VHLDTGISGVWNSIDIIKTLSPLSARYASPSDLSQRSIRQEANSTFICRYCCILSDSSSLLPISTGKNDIRSHAVFLMQQTTCYP
jgi:hypothetical protein